MLNGQTPFRSSDKKQFTNLINEGDYTFNNRVKKTMTVECVSFINRCLQFDEEKRANIQELVNHPYITRTLKEQKNIKHNHSNCFLEEDSM